VTKKTPIGKGGGTRPPRAILQHAVPIRTHPDEWVSRKAKLLFLEAFQKSGITQAELAQRLKVTPAGVTRLFDLAHVSKIDSLAEALKAIGGRYVLTVESL